MNRELKPKSDVTRLYICSENIGSGLVSIESYTSAHKNNLARYDRYNAEDILEMVKLYKKNLNVNDLVDLKQFKKDQNKEKIKDLHNKKRHSQFFNKKEEYDWNKSWEWIKRGDLKGCIEDLVFSAQKQLLRTNQIKYHMDNTTYSPLCWTYSEKGETIHNFISECSKLVQQ